MSRYKDKLDREWSIDLDFGLVEEVRKRHDLDLIDLAGIGRAFVAFAYSDLRLMGELLYTLCEDQVKAKGLTPEEFGKGHNGATLERAKLALEEAISDFSPSPEMKEAKAKLFRAANKTVAGRVDSLTEAHLLEKMSGGAPTSVPASSE